MSSPKTLKTWAGRSSFKYSGSVRDGITVIYGEGHRIKITVEQFLTLINHFQGLTVQAGTSRADAPRRSVGKWLQENVTQTAMASYVCPILINEGYAEKGGSTEIRFY
ncbi:MAG: hypothetical protein ACLP2P_05035 [Desulfobaccales bacterium]